MISKIAERLKSPVVWGVLLTTLYTQLELWQSEGATPKTIILGVLMVIVATFGAVNNPTDRDNM